MRASYSREVPATANFLLLAPRPLDQLSPESRAVLSLVLLQSRSYGDIADLLRLGEDDVRDRAHAAAEGLVPPEGGPGPEARARIIDYMLGEQTVSARAQTRSELQSSEIARSWAAQLAAALAPLAKSPLPSIPEAPPRPRRPTPVTQGSTPLFTPQSAVPRRRPPDQGFPLGRLAAAGAVALAAIVALVIVLASSGGSSKPSTTVAVSVPTTGITGTNGHAGRTVQKLVLHAAGSNHNALGAGAVVRQKDGSLLLLLQARGLTPNSTHNAYAVWLFNTPNDAHLLGFVKPAVGTSGTFSSGVTLSLIHI